MLNGAFLGPRRPGHGATREPITPSAAGPRTLLAAARKGVRLALAAATLACATPDRIPRPPELAGQVWSKPGATPADFDLDRAGCETDWILHVGRHLDESRRLPRPADLEPCIRSRGWRPRGPVPDPE